MNEALAAAERLDAERKGRERKAATGKDAPPRAGSGDTAKDKEAKKCEPGASTTDPEAKVMKMADGGFRPAYKVQFAADTRSGAVAGVSLDAVGSDMGRMAPMNEPSRPLTAAGHASISSKVGSPSS